MVTLRTILKQFYLGLLLLSAFIPCVASGLSTTPPGTCNAQCQRFLSWGFSMDIAGHGDDIKKIMDITRIDTNTHDSKSFLDAIDSNWSPHNSDSEYSEYTHRILSTTIKLGMNTPYNEIPLYTSKGTKLQVIILGSHPKQLCSFLAQLVQFRHRIHQTIMIGSSTPLYEDADYLNCSALNSSQRLELRRIAQNQTLSSDRDIMDVYFNEPDFNAFFPVVPDSLRGDLRAIFSNNHLMLAYLEANTQMGRLHSSIIIAAPQPYIPEAMSILRRKLRNATIYRFSSVGDFNIYESLNALRSWLQTDHKLIK